MALRKTQLKEMYIVRYADDFKIFCRKRSDADKVFIAVKQWLQDRLKLQISEEKSKVINLKKHYSEYLGFKLKAVKKGDKYVVRSHMRDKAVRKVTDELIDRFGDVPDAVKGLIDIALIRSSASSYGVYEIKQLNDAMLLYLADVRTPKVGELMGKLAGQGILRLENKPHIYSDHFSDYGWQAQ